MQKGEGPHFKLHANMGVFSHRKGGTVERFKTFLTCPPLTLNTIVVVHPTCKPVTLPAVSLSILNLKQLVAYLVKTMSHFYDTRICGASAYHRKINFSQPPAISMQFFSRVFNCLSRVLLCGIQAAAQRGPALPARRPRGETLQFARKKKIPSERARSRRRPRRGGGGWPSWKLVPELEVRGALRWGASTQIKTENKRGLMLFS